MCIAIIGLSISFELVFGTSGLTLISRAWVGEDGESLSRKDWKLRVGDAEREVDCGGLLTAGCSGESDGVSRDCKDLVFEWLWLLNCSFI